jgi:hypothetical protein
MKEYYGNIFLDNILSKCGVDYGLTLRDYRCKRVTLNTVKLLCGSNGSFRKV